MQFVDGFDSPARTREQAIDEASDLLRGPQLAAGSPGTTPGVDRDPARVDTVDDTSTGSARYRAAKTQVTANAAIEKVSLATLSPQERAQYAHIKAACARDPVAQLALQKLLLDGTLGGSKSLEATLSQLATSTPLAKGIDRRTLVGNLVQELAAPSSIDQGLTGTCAPTTVATQLAMTDPAEYARLIAGLASKRGRVELAGGLTLQREVGTIADDGSGRASTQRLLGPALMQLMSDGDDFDYDNRDPAMRARVGTSPESLELAYEALRNRPMESMQILQFPGQPNPAAAKGIDLIRHQLEQGLSVSIGYRPGAQHQVLITGASTCDGEKGFTFIDPEGREAHISEAELRKTLGAVMYDPATVSPALVEAAEATTAEMKRFQATQARDAGVRPTPTRH